MARADLAFQALTRSREEWDRFKRERDQLLQAIEEHRAEKAHCRTANMELADGRLYSVADRVKGEG